MSDIIEEVDEAYAQDQALRWWKRLSPFLYALIAILILSVAGYELLKWNSARQHKVNSEAFYTARTALQDNDYALAEALFDDILNSKSPYSEIAGNYLAQTRLAGLGDREGALAALKKAAEGEGPFAQVARLKAGYIMADAASLEELDSWLAPLVNDTTSPYSYLGQEAAAARAFSLGEYEEAKSRYNALSLALDVPQDIRGRADRAIIAIEAIQARNGSSS